MKGRDTMDRRTPIEIHAAANGWFLTPAVTRIMNQTPIWEEEIYVFNSIVHLLDWIREHMKEKDND